MDVVVPHCARIQLGGGKKVNLCGLGSGRLWRGWQHAEFAWQGCRRRCSGARCLLNVVLAFAKTTSEDMAGLLHHRGEVNGMIIGTRRQ
jgi:hypothetical protein